METIQMEAVQVRCNACHAEIENQQSWHHERAVYCPNCYQDLIASCRCGKSLLKEEMTSIHEKWYCDHCRSELFSFCDGCETYTDITHAVYSERRGVDYCPSCAEECISYCIHCSTEVDPDHARTNNSGDYVCDSCRDEQTDIEDTDENEESFVELTGTSFERCKSQRKFGVEIEALLESAEDSHLSGDLAGWKKQQDGSLGDSGREYSSPILQGDEGFKNIEEFCLKLMGWGYFVRKECGLHIHIDGRDLDYEDIRKLLKLVLNYESIIYAMLPDSRFTGHYSVPLGKFPRSRIRKTVKSESDLKALWYGKDRDRVNLKSKFHGSRYYGVNIHSWFFRRSVEFRYHSGTLNSGKITSFIHICQTIVDKAKNEKRVTKCSFESFNEQFEHFVSYFGFSDEIREYVKVRIMKFHPHLFNAPVSPVGSQSISN